jgi:hypothetical protein
MSSMQHEQSKKKHDAKASDSFEKGETSQPPQKGFAREWASGRESEPGRESDPSQHAGKSCPAD